MPKEIILYFFSQVAAKVIGEVQALIIFPVIPYAILAIFYMLWLSAALNLFSSGRVTQNICNSNCCAYDLKIKKVRCDSCCGYSIQYTPHIAAAILFHLFGCYWATQFFVACSSTVLAGSVASYYWARGEASVSFQDVIIQFLVQLFFEFIYISWDVTKSNHVYSKCSKRYHFSLSLVQWRGLYVTVWDP